MIEEQMICDFSTRCLQWQHIDDVVMGGVSGSLLRRDADGTASFTGRLSLDNEGGFASVRTLLDDRQFDAFDGIRIRVKGDGKRYSFRIRNDERFDGIVYKQDFYTMPDEWVVIDLPFHEFKPSFRGRIMHDAPPLDPGNIIQIGFLISMKQEGPFCLQIEWIKAYKAASGDGNGKSL
jgi:hypothetical protein